MVEDEGEIVTVARSHETMWSMMRSLDFNLRVVKRHWRVLSKGVTQSELCLFNFNMLNLHIEH